MRKNFTRLITNVNSMKWQPQVAGLLLLFMMLVSQTAVGQTINYTNDLSNTSSIGITRSLGTFSVSSGQVQIIGTSSGGSQAGRGYDGFISIAERTFNFYPGVTYRIVIQGQANTTGTLEITRGASNPTTASPGITIGTINIDVSGGLANYAIDYTVNTIQTNQFIGFHVSSFGSDNRQLILDNISITQICNILPSAPSTISNNRCGSGILQLSASGAPNGGSYRWYAASSGGTAIAGVTGPNYTTPSLSTTTSYWVSAVSPAGCESAVRTEVIATVNSVPVAPTTTSSSRCGTGTVELSASGAPTTGSYRWYTQQSGGNAISGVTEATYTTPSISSTASYWVSTVSAAGCESASRTEVIATINAIPAAPATTSGSSCGAGVVELSASGAPSNGSYRWYTVSSGGSAISGVTGPTYSPDIAITTTYYVSTVSAAGCESTSRTAVTATVNEVPTAPSTTPDTRCGAGTVSLSASGTPSGGSYRWYTVPSNGTAISGATGATYSPNVTETTTYYVSSVSAAGCEGPRAAVTATVNPVPTVQITNPEAVCTPNTVNLQAAAVTAGSTSGLTYTYWRDAGATLMLLNPDQISVSGTYYIKGTTPEGCFDIKPVAVVVNQTPNAPTLAGTPNEICGSGTTQLSVSGAPAGGRYQWYTSETGATAIPGAENSTYTTPTISVSTTYYVSAISAAGCESATRTAVTAVVNPIPGAATVPIPEARCGAGPVSMTATAGTNANSARWYSGGGTLLFTGLDYNPSNVSVTTTFYVSSYNTETGCESTIRTAVTATVITPPTVTITTTTPTTFCVNGSVVLSARVTPASPEEGTYTYQWRKNGIDIPGASANNPTFTASEPGNYTVVVSTTVGGCVSAPSSPVTVTVLPQPTSSVSGEDQAKCIGANNSTSFTVSGTFANGNARWTSSNPDFAIRNPSYSTSTGIATATVVATGTGSSIITLTTSNSNASCNDASSEITLTVNPLPVAAIVPTGPTTFCVGDYVILEATEAPAGQEYSYEWFINNGSQVIGTDPTFEARVSGNYTVKITTKPGCSATSSQIAVKVDQLDVATVSVTGATTFCQGGSVRLDAVKAPSGQEQYSYQWYKGTETVGTNSSTYIANATGEYYVVVSAQGCEKTSDKVTVTVLPQPTASITVPAENGRTVCQDPDGVTTFTVSGTFSGGEAAWTSSNTSFVISGRNDVLNASTGITTSAITVTVSGVLTSTISSTINLRTTNAVASCAPASSSISLAVNPIPVATITPSGNTEFCAGNSITLTASAGSSYLWSTGATTRVITVSTSGDYSVTVTNSSGCSITSPVTSVKVNSLPDVRLAAFEPVCKDQEAFTLTGGLPAGGTYTINGVAATQFNPAAYAVGNHTIVYTYRDGNNCSASASQTIQVKAVPVVTLSAIEDRCIDAVPLTLTGGSPAGGTYSGTGVANGVFNPATAGVGIHTITYSYTDNGCTKTATNTIEVTPTPVVALAAFNNVCVNATAFALTGGSPAGGTYSGTGVSNGQFNPATAGVGPHTITYTYSENGCIRSATNTITVNPLPIATAGTYAAKCVGTGNQTAFNLTAGSISHGTPTWAFVDGTNGATATIVNANTMSPTVTVTGTGTVTVRLTATSNQSPGCTPSANSETTLTVNALPVVSITSPENDSYCTAQGAIPLTGNPTGGSFTVNGVAATTFNPSTLGAGTYTIVYTYTNGSGCTNTATKTIRVNQTPTVNAIANRTHCNAEAGAAITFGSSVNGATYRWASTADVGFGTGGTGNAIGAYTAKNIGTTAVTATVRVWAMATSCEGPEQIFTVMVNPTPAVNTITNRVHCNSDAAAVIAFGGSVNGAQYTWTSSVDVGFGTGGTGNIGAYTARNTGTTAVTATVRVRASANNCQGPEQTFTVTVNPTPVATFSGVTNGQVVLSDGGNITLTPTVAGGKFTIVSPANTSGLTEGGILTPCTALASATEKEITIRYTLSRTANSVECTAYEEKKVILKRSTYRTIITADPFPFCRGAGGTTYTAKVYRDPQPGDIIYPYLANENGDPINENGALIPTGPGNYPIPNMSYPFPANTPESIKAMAFRFFQPIISPALQAREVSAASFDYQWNKNDKNDNKSNTPVVSDASLSSQDYITVKVTSKNSNGICTSVDNLQSNRIYSAILEGYTVNLTATPNPICPGGAVTFTATLGAGFPWAVANMKMDFVLTSGNIVLHNTTYAGSNTITFTTDAATAGGFRDGDQVSARFSTDLLSWLPNSNCINAPISNTITVRVNDIVEIPNPTPNNISICLGGQATFTAPVTTTGPATVNYLWRVGGTTYNTTTPSLTVTTPLTSTPGSYPVSVVVSNICETTATLNLGTLTVLEPTAIATQPLGNTVCAGASHTFAVNATGVGLTYQWLRNGASIPGATSASYSITNAQPSDAANYSVRVMGTCGTINTTPVAFVVNVPPTITQHPASQAVCVGQTNVTMSIGASGSNLSYKWYKDGVLQPGQTGNSYIIPVVGAGDAGNYTVQVSGACVPDQLSNAGVLTVNTIPAVAVTSPTVCQGTMATVTATPSDGSGSYTYNWTVPAAWTGDVPTTASFETNIPGEYKVTVTSNNCTSVEQTSMVTINPVIPADGEIYIFDEEGVQLASAKDMRSGVKYTFRVRSNILDNFDADSTKIVWSMGNGSDNGWGVMQTGGTEFTMTEPMGTLAVSIKCDIPKNPGTCYSLLSELFFSLSTEVIVPLPVELLYFNAKKQGADVVLDWATASELDNKGFEVQVSSDAKNFRVLGFVDSKVNTTSLKQVYSFVDKENGKQGVRYYRLKQVDLDGKFEIFNIKAVHFDVVSANKVKAYPNPFHSEVELSIDAELDGELQITVTTATGQQLLQRSVQVAKGTNVEKLTLDPNLPRGVYIISTRMGDFNSHFKLLKQ